MLAAGSQTDLMLANKSTERKESHLRTVIFEKYSNRFVQEYRHTRSLCSSADMSADHERNRSCYGRELQTYADAQFGRVHFIVDVPAENDGTEPYERQTGSSGKEGRTECGGVFADP